MVKCEWSLTATPLFTCNTRIYNFPTSFFYREPTYRRGSRYGTGHVLPVNSSVYTQSPPSTLRCLPHEPLSSIKFGQSCDARKVSREQMRCISLTCLQVALNHFTPDWMYGWVQVDKHIDRQHLHKWLALTDRFGVYLSPMLLISIKLQQN